jgi:hypothetical protein
MSQEYFVFIEHFLGQVTDISYMLLAQAKKLAGADNGKVVAILTGSKVEGLAVDLAADTVLYIDDPAFADILVSPVPRQSLVLSRGKNHVWFCLAIPRLVPKWSALFQCV